MTVKTTDVVWEAMNMGFHLRKKQPVLSENDFQSMRPCKLKLFRVPLSPKINEVKNFEQTDIDYLHEVVDKINEKRKEKEPNTSGKGAVLINSNGLAYHFTTQSPFTRTQLIGITADKANVNYLDAKDKEEVKATWTEFNQAIADLQAVTAWMFQDKKAASALYGKFFVDLIFLKEMRSFIRRQSLKIVDKKDLLMGEREINQKMQDKVLEAIGKTETGNTLDKLLKYGKMAVYGAAIGWGIFKTAQTELIELFRQFVDTPNLVYVAMAFGALLGIIVYDTTGERRKARKEKKQNKEFSNERKHLVAEEEAATWKILKGVGYKAVKEMAISGYLESLEDVSNAYYAAAYKGDLHYINMVYNLQTLPKSWLARIIPPFFGYKNGDVKIDNLVMGDAMTADGHIIATKATPAESK